MGDVVDFFFNGDFDDLFFMGNAISKFMDTFRNESVGGLLILDFCAISASCLEFSVLASCFKTASFTDLYHELKMTYFCTTLLSLGLLVFLPDDLSRFFSL